ncbi:MAG: winged helix-turn-helix domain-containing protein [Haloarculaceae archaeon]
MPTEAEDTHVTALSPDDAFAVLGNETRIGILQELGTADEPMTFSALHDAVGMVDSGNFNYHLEKLQGHFVRKTDDGYRLRQAGHRVVEAIFSGTVTEAPVLETTSVDVPCIYCGAGTEVSYREERLLWRCPECPGSFAGLDATSEAFGTLPPGTIDLAYLPSAGVQGRTPREMLEASDTWSAAERVALANGVCPRCSGTVEDSLTVCEDHDSGDGVCEACHTRFGVSVRSRCTNCTHSKGGTLAVHLQADRAFRSVFESRGIDVISTPLEEMSALVVDEQEVLGTDPFRARITFVVDGDEVALVVDDDLSVAEVIE